MKIRADHRETEPCKTEMLVTWLRQSKEASWSTVVWALVGMRMGTLAQKVALKYGESHHTYYSLISHVSTSYAVRGTNICKTANKYSGVTSVELSSNIIMCREKYQQLI